MSRTGVGFGDHDQFFSFLHEPPPVSVGSTAGSQHAGQLTGWQAFGNVWVCIPGFILEAFLLEETRRLGDLELATLMVLYSGELGGRDLREKVICGKLASSEANRTTTSVGRGYVMKDS